MVNPTSLGYQMRNIPKDDNITYIIILVYKWYKYTYICRTMHPGYQNSTDDINIDNCQRIHLM